MRSHSHEKHKSPHKLIMHMNKGYLIAAGTFLLAAVFNVLTIVDFSAVGEVILQFTQVP